MKQQNARPMIFRCASAHTWPFMKRVAVGALKYFGLELSTCSQPSKTIRKQRTQSAHLLPIEHDFGAKNAKLRACGLKTKEAKVRTCGRS